MTILKTTMNKVVEYLAEVEAIASVRVASNMSNYTLVIMATEHGMFDGNAVEAYSAVYIDGININYYFHKS